MTAKRVLVSFAVVLAAVGMFPVVSTQPGAHVISVTQAFLLFYSGVFSLIAFTAAVVWGLLAAERFMPVRYRVLAQGVHRMFGLLGLGFLLTHIVLQILAEHAHAVDAVVPFLDTDDRLVATGLGTIAADLMLVVYVVGKLRHRFVNSARPWVWRIIHGIAYLSWPIAITHGLTAGRPVKGTWVTVSYVVCLALVVLALIIRLFSPFPAAKVTGREEPDESPAGRPDRPSRGPGARPRERPQERGRERPRERVRPLADAELREAARRRESVPMPRGVPRESGPLPRIPRESGPMPRVPEETGPMRWVPRETGPLPRVPGGSGPMPAAAPRQGTPRQAVPLPKVPSPSPSPSVPPRERVRPAAPAETQRERLLIPDRPDDDPRQPRHWLDAVERFPFFQQLLPRRQARSRPIVSPDIEEVEFWANLRAETSVWIRRGRR